jgi:hypothetical protein
MQSESTKLPIKSGSESLIPIADRKWIEAIEEYRFEIRRRFEEQDARSGGRSQFWREKLFAPALIVLLTVGLSGYGIPKVLESADRSRRANALTAELLQEIAEKATEMQAAIDARSDAIDSYWADVSRTNAVVGEFALKRDIGEMTVEEFTRQDTLIENDRKRISAAFDASADEYAKELRVFRPWLQRMRMRVDFLYRANEKRSAVEQALLKIGSDLPKAEIWLKERQDRYEQDLYKQILAAKLQRQRFRRGEITADEYKRSVDPIVDRLRVPVRMAGSPYALDPGAIASVLKFVRDTVPDA